MADLEYNKEGNIILPFSIKEDKRIVDEKLEMVKKNPDKVVVEYEEETPGYEDHWTLSWPTLIPRKILFEMKSWVDSRCEIQDGFATIEENGDSEYILKVRGKQNRCTWAHSFLTGLNTKLINRHNSQIIQKSTCKHGFKVKIKVFRGGA